MGNAIVPHLVRGCTSVTVWNRSANKCGAAASAGARVAQSLAQVVEASDIVLSILLDDAAVTEVYLAGNGLLGEECAGRAFVEMSTIKPETVRAIARAARARGASLVDAPVSGTVGPARDGKLLVLAGGEVADVARISPVLSLFSRKIVHMGPTGSGASMKLALQLPLYVYWQALGEALSIGRASGLGLSDMVSLIAESPAAIGMLDAKMPVLLDQDGQTAFALSAALKDLRLIKETGGDLGIPVPCAIAAVEAYEAATRHGWGERDVARLVPFIMDMATSKRAPE
jgi:3-hydroxyisobutyrate dehydrogenase-like beta-hydroxyacid dehydrogenase